MQKTSLHADVKHEFIVGLLMQVAACICLFSLDKPQAIPVDTHVWQLACKYYTPNLKGKYLSLLLVDGVEDERCAHAPQIR